ncbi:MAG TPA: ABC-type transport auxiliary lipoprotein family protein [Opitutaceae bacterium]|nr:ABC-type transport auxiliary lipoprotein family protein [Opitutaceae bacterium]
MMTSLVMCRLSLPGFCLLVAGLSVLPAGCSLPGAKPDAARYYVLPTLAEAAVPPASVLHVGLFPVQLPDYLHSRSMAVREGASEVRYHDDERWAETLDAGLTRVLRAKLAASAQVVVYPFRSDAPRNYDVRVQVLACEGTADGGVVFSATFEIFAPGAGAGVQHAFTAEPVKWDGRDYAKLAELLGTDAAQLADAIAAALPAK